MVQFPASCDACALLYTMKTTTQLVTRHEAAAALGISVRTMDDLISKGEVPVVRVGRSVRIRPSALDYFVEARETHAKRRR
jgi:excisionase family DNA binding protein